MNKIYIIIEGYAHAGKNGTYVASPSTCLIDTGDKKILVDPGANEKKLLYALKEIQVLRSDISFVYLSHYHPDHFLNLKLFLGIDVYDGEMIWSDDREMFHKGNLNIDGIEILKTPGHSDEHTSLLVETDEGKVCIAQDVFWWEDGKQKSGSVKDLLSLKDPFANDIKALRKSRKLVLEKADWIVPGHGKKFRCPEK